MWAGSSRLSFRLCVISNTLAAYDIVSVVSQPVESRQKRPRPDASTSISLRRV